ncbi:nitrile hydratase accessory protein [Rhabdaerophilum sp. SD176]|uniref:nitrile hydratase accessory protein n=1 Tax=Rhabdaerophilum sp. SD176 TaxID=2983548 RepID=UPI0024E01558|nr:nitrile hydratase accessory protein [Rhabdaerophilum sp. SD176]
MTTARSLTPEDEPVFSAPWQAQAFAMTLALHERGAFTWDEWATRLGATLANAGPADDGSRYYEHWLATLETLVAEKGVASWAELDDRREAWDRAARATPHGEPIELGREARDHSEA